MNGTRVPAVLLHGALRSSVGLWPTAAYLRRRGVDARPFGYTTRKGGLLDHARALDSFITTSFAEAPPVLGFVTHSMGALVVRAWLGLLDTEARGQRQRIVMLSPPNRGSSLAERNRARALMRVLYGDAVAELQPSRVLELPPHSCAATREAIYAFVTPSGSAAKTVETSPGPAAARPSGPGCPPSPPVPSVPAVPPVPACAPSPSALP